MFGGEHDVLLLLLLEVAGRCRRGQGDLTDLPALGAHSCLDGREGRGERGGQLGGELGLVPSGPRLFLLRGRHGGRGRRGGGHADVGGRQRVSSELSVLGRGVGVGGGVGHFILESGNDCDGAERGGRRARQTEAEEMQTVGRKEKGNKQRRTEKRKT